MLDDALAAFFICSPSELLILALSPGVAHLALTAQQQLCQTCLLCLVTLLQSSMSYTQKQQSILLDFPEPQALQARIFSRSLQQLLYKIDCLQRLSHSFASMLVLCMLQP